jgi:NitT/TauT family transport system substrate-binding protein
MRMLSRSVALAATSIALLVTACGGGAETTSPSGDGGLTTIKVGVVPVSTIAPLYLAMDQGYFEAVGLKVEPVPINSSPAVVASAVSGEVQFGFAPVAATLQARAQRIPVQVVLGGTSTELSQNSSSLMASTKSGIKKTADLAGKTIAVNDLQGQSELGIRANAKAAGVDQASMKFVALPFPDMVAALESGRVDAAGMVVPFSQAARDVGAVEVIPDYYKALDPKISVTNWFASERYIKESEATVKKFTEALMRGFDYAIKNDDEVARILPQFTKNTEEQARKLPRVAQSPTLNMDWVAKQAALMVEFGWLKEAPNLDGFVAEPVRDLIVD